MNNKTLTVADKLLAGIRLRKPVFAKSCESDSSSENTYVDEMYPTIVPFFEDYPSDTNSENPESSHKKETIKPP